MPFELETYYNISEKGERLSEIYKKYGAKAVFIVPDGLDMDLLLQLLSGGGSFFGRRPAAWTWSDFYRETAKGGGGYRRVIDPPDHNLVINYVLKEYLSEVAAEGGKLPPGVTRRGFASLLGENIRELLREEIFPGRMNAALDIDESNALSPAAILCRLYSGYIGYLNENQIADSAQVPTLARLCLNLPANERFLSEHIFVFVGFLSFAGGQLNLVKTLSEMADCLFLLPETGLDSFYDSIRQLGAEYGERPRWSVNICRLIAGGEYFQYEALARELALWRGGEGELGKLGTLADYGEIGMQVAPRHLQTAQNALARYKIPNNAQVRENAGETQAGELLRAIWEAWFSEWETKKTVSLLSGPLLGGSPPECAEQFPEGSSSWLALLKGEKRRQFTLMEELCRAFTEGGPPALIMTLWRDFLNELRPADTLAAAAGGELSLDGVIRDINAVLEELDKKIEILGDLKRDIGPAADIRLAGPDAVAYIADWGRTARLPIPLPQSGSLTIYGGNPPVLARHKYWIMTGVDYNNWPGVLRESPLLRDDEKKLLNREAQDAEAAEKSHIPELHEKREQKEALFRRLIATGESGVILVRSATDSNGRPVGDSQFAEALFNPDKADPQRRCNDLGKIEYPVSRMLPGAGDLWFPEAEAHGCSEKLGRGTFPRIAEKPGEETMRVPLSSLDDWNSCPFLYWCRKIAGLESRRRDIYDYLRAGTLVHRLWEVCWSDYLQKNISLSQLVVTNWRGTAEREYPELLGDRRLRRQELLLRKRSAELAELQEQIEARVRGRNNVGMEYRLPEYELDGVIFMGRADRIDFYDGGAVVLDYKSGRAGAYKKDVQLAAYAAVLREKAGLKVGGYGLFGLRDGSLDGYFTGDYHDIYRGSGRKAKEETLEEKIEGALTVMREMAAALKAGLFPAKKSRDRCPRCEFSVLCRRREDSSGQLDEETADEEAGGCEQR